MNRWSRLAALSTLFGLVLAVSLTAGEVADLQSKLKALEAAHAAGILDDAEYARKKADLEAQLRAAQPQLNEATQKRLKALDAAREAGILTDEEHARKKAEILGQTPKPAVAPPVAPPVPPAPPAPTPVPVPVPAAPRAGKTCRHPGGFSFWYPAEWTAQEQEGNVQLVPPNPGTANGAPTELYFVAVEDLAQQNIQRPDDPRLIQLLDTQIKSLSATLARLEGAPQVAMGTSKGVALDWGARTPDGTVIRARVFVGLLKANAVALVAMGLKERLDAREADLRLIFASVGTGQAPSAPVAIVPAQPLPPTAPTVQPTPATPAAPVPDLRKKGKLYRHAIGFTFWHPETWAVKELQGYLQLTPPDPGMKDNGPTELYFVIGERVADEGIVRPNDPRVLEYLDAQVHNVAPTLQRVGAVGAAAMANGEGASLRWQATSADGSVVRALAFASIIKQHGVALMAIGLKERLDAREAVLREMFASFGFGEGKRDPQLAGKWSLVSTYALSNESPFETSWSKARMVSERQTALTLSPDGTWHKVEARHMLAGAGGLWIEDKGQKVSDGTWNAENGSLYMMGKDDSWEQYQYQLRQGAEGRELRLVSGKTGLAWKESR